MKKIIVLTAVTTILLAGGTQEAWAGKKAHQENGDYRAFRKIVRVLDVLVNDEHRHHKGTQVRVRKYYYPKKVCYRKGRHKVCYLKRHGHGCRQCGHKRHYKKYSKNRYHDRYDHYDQKYYERH